MTARTSLLRRRAHPVVGLWCLALATAVIARPCSGRAEIRFTDVTTAAGLADPGAERGVAWGDYDADGRPDIFVAVLDGPDQLFRNLGGGRFAAVPAAMAAADPGRSACGYWGDYDGDGDLDLFVGRAGPNSLYRNDGTDFTDVRAAAGLADTLVTWGAAWADFDADGRLDLYVANFGLMPNRLYRNLGGDRFEDVAARLGVADEGHSTGAAWADHDGDGDLDLYVANKDGPDRLYRNENGEAFTDVTEAAGLMDPTDSTAAVWGDADNDGDADLFVAKDKAGNVLFLNGGDGRFVDATADAGLAYRGSSRGAGWGDADNDGDLDLYLVLSDGPNRLYLNEGPARFTRRGEAAGVADPRTGAAAAWADMDGDGDLDLLLSNFAQPLCLYENRQDTGNRWLAVDLAADGANTLCVGATVRVWCGDRVFTREQTHGGGGYQSQAPALLHFGLGGAAQFDSLRVAWPGGGVSRLGPGDADRRVTVRRP